MKVFLGNEEKSVEFTNKLKDYAWYNMFEFSDLAKASQQMIAYGHEVDNIIPRLDLTRYPTDIIISKLYIFVFYFFPSKAVIEDSSNTD